MKRLVLIAVVALTGCFFPYPKANAISHQHRAELAKSHKTQVDEVMPVTVKMSCYGITFRIEPDGIGYIDDKAASISEANIMAIAYQCGISTVIWYKDKHKAALIQEGHFVGYLK